MSQLNNINILSIPNANQVFEFIRNQENISENCQMIEGENGMYSYRTTGNKNLDLFSKLSRNSDRDTIKRMFMDAYNEDKVMALQIMMNYRDREGKQEKKIGRTLMEFLKERCPYTYMANLLLFINLGYIKDLSELHILTKNINNEATGIEATIYSKLLKIDRDEYENNNQISLTAKWAPRENSKYSDLAKEIANKLSDERNESLRLKEYRKKYLSPLNEKLNTLERNLTLRKYDKIKIEQIPSTALKKTKKAIETHMKERYIEFINKCKTGEVKVKTTGLQPHELIKKIEIGDELAEIQLDEIINKLREMGIFENTLPVCDVSGSMSGIPMEVSVALGYVLSQLQNDEFKNKLITFSENPTLHNLRGNTTKDRLNNIRKMDWGINTNFIRVFEMLLEDALKRKINEENMVKKIIVFTDMEFDCAQSGGPYNTGYEYIKNKYEENDLILPQIVFWNLRDSRTSFPVKHDTPGVALMNGFSSEMLKVFMDGDDMSPMAILRKSISKYNVINLNEEIN